MYPVGILTISTKGSQGQREDLSGPAILKIVTDNLGWQVVQTDLIPDNQAMIEQCLRDWSDEVHLALILTTGGTGFAPSDVTPEATRAVIQREAPGLAEAMRAASLAKTPHAMLTRNVAGIRGRTLIINLPGSPKAVRENLEVILPALPHAIELLWDVSGADNRHSGNDRKR